MRTADYWTGVSRILDRRSTEYGKEDSRMVDKDSIILDMSTAGYLRVERQTIGHGESWRGRQENVRPWDCRKLGRKMAK
jgi:hypothetical protein